MFKPGSMFTGKASAGEMFKIFGWCAKQLSTYWEFDLDSSVIILGRDQGGGCEKLEINIKFYQREDGLKIVYFKKIYGDLMEFFEFVAGFKQELEKFFK